MRTLTLKTLKAMDIDNLRDVAGDDELYSPETREMARKLVDEFDS